MGGPGFGHEPVMVTEVLEHLRPERGGWYLDGTVGGGGHAEAVLRRSSRARLIAMDRDPVAVEAARERLAAYGDRARVVRGDFRDAGRIIGSLAERAGDGAETGGTDTEAKRDETTRSKAKTEILAGALLDLGVSSHQIDDVARGFSFRPGTSLNMRMGGTTGGRRPAATFLDEASEEELGRVFREYGDVRRWRRLAREVTRQRERRPFETSDDLVEAMKRAMGGHVSARDRARVFQAVRIAVNEEMEALDAGLPAIRDLLAPNGRFVVISYHSVEDRRVKHEFRDWSRACVCPPRIPVCRCRGRPLGRTLTSGPVTPAESEIERNPRSRSGKLRAWEKA